MTGEWRQVDGPDPLEPDADTAPGRFDPRPSAAEHARRDPTIDQVGATRRAVLDPNPGGGGNVNETFQPGDVVRLGNQGSQRWTIEAVEGTILRLSTPSRRVGEPARKNSVDITKRVVTHLYRPEGDA